MTDFATATERLLTQVRHWQQPRWSAPAGSGTRADTVFALVQRLADVGAEAERRAPRPVPREHDVILPDQFRVMADDLLATDPAPELLNRATDAVDEVRRSFSGTR